MTPTLMFGTAEADEDEFDEFALDITVIEDSLPLTKMGCDTSDNCGGTTCGSACTSAVTQPR